ncbi:MAG: hypothetical protein ABI548_29565 [Polyangiaceae bacterium]
MTKINTFLLENALSIATNPCIPQDFWLNWPRLRTRLDSGQGLTRHPLSEVQTALGSFSLLEDADGDHAWVLRGDANAAHVFADSESCSALDSLHPNPEHMFWFEYNFLYVLATQGRAQKSALGDHTAEGDRQRARFYAVSEAGRLAYAKNVAEYLLFLAETTGMASDGACSTARAKLASYETSAALLVDIAPLAPTRATMKCSRH